LPPRRSSTGELRHEHADDLPTKACGLDGLPGVTTVPAGDVDALRCALNMTRQSWSSDCRNVNGKGNGRNHGDILVRTRYVPVISAR
jgi:hypothetical protein